MQSEDVLHGFYVPEFRVKQDIIPNRTITMVFTPLRSGKYRLNDSQFSGTNFALMEADVYVESPEAYNQWFARAANRPEVRMRDVDCLTCLDFEREFRAVEKVKKEVIDDK